MGDKCPDCGGEVMYYHASAKQDGITSVVCRKKCGGWKVIKEIDRLFELKKKQKKEMEGDYEIHTD